MVLNFHFRGIKEEYISEECFIDDIIVGIEISNCGACQETEYIDIVILGGKLYLKKEVTIIKLTAKESWELKGVAVLIPL